MTKMASPFLLITVDRIHFVAAIESHLLNSTLSWVLVPKVSLLVPPVNPTVSEASL